MRAAVYTQPVANVSAAPSPAASSTRWTLNGSTSTQAQGHAAHLRVVADRGPGGDAVQRHGREPDVHDACCPDDADVPVDRDRPVNPITGNAAGGKVSVAKTVTVTIVADKVTANTGANQTGKVAGNVITLDGSASIEPDGLPLQYTWTQVANGAPTVTLSNPNAQKPTFTAPPAVAAAGYVAAFNLSVTNGGANPAHDSDTTVTPVTITVAASTPTVVVTRNPSGTVFTGDLVTLGATITNPDGNPADYTYLWSQTTGRTTTLSSRRPRRTRPSSCRRAAPVGATPRCARAVRVRRARRSANCPRFSVVVTKINTAKASTNTALAGVRQHVADPSGRQRRTRADARHRCDAERDAGRERFDTSAEPPHRVHVVADRRPDHRDALRHARGPCRRSRCRPTRACTRSSSSSTTLRAGSPVPGTNGNTSTPATVTVTFKFQSPIVSAGNDQTVKVNDPVTLSTSSASQLNGHSLTYQWTQTDGTPVGLDDPTTRCTRASPLRFPTAC